MIPHDYILADPLALSSIEMNIESLDYIYVLRAAIKVHSIVFGNSSAAGSFATWLNRRGSSIILLQHFELYLSYYASHFHDTNRRREQVQLFRNKV